MSRIVRGRREVCARDHRILREGAGRRLRGHGRHRWRGELPARNQGCYLDQNKNEIQFKT